MPSSKSSPLVVIPFPSRQLGFSDENGWGDGAAERQ